MHNVCSIDFSFIKNEIKIYVVGALIEQASISWGDTYYKARPGRGSGARLIQV